MMSKNILKIVLHVLNFALFVINKYQLINILHIINYVKSSYITARYWIKIFKNKKFKIKSNIIIILIIIIF